MAKRMSIITDDKLAKYGSNTQEQFKNVQHQIDEIKKCSKAELKALHEQTGNTATQKLIEEKNYEDRVQNVFCMTDPTSVGCIEFRTLASKNGFHKMMRENPIKVQGASSEKSLRLTDNLTKTERRDMKQLGFTKYHLNRLLGIPLENIRIMRDTLSIQVLGKMAAIIVNGEIEYHNQGVEVKVSVSQSMREWDAKGPKNE
ncbi:unnamed protein product [Prorocentrum cordatum]|uniref:Uncharacterized protein n=1 Tax=Prorocentrum cordatum TaxID=2364126 RepID=A0ABN9Y1B1_9DINO|nr:unnamed protein product [Polarella glacialis]